MFFPEGDADLAHYQRLTAEFGEYDNFLFVAVFTGENATEAPFLDSLHTLTATLASWPEVTQVVSPTNHRRLQLTPFGANSIPLYSPGKSLIARQVLLNDMIGQYFDKELKSALIIVRHQPFALKSDGDLFHRKLVAHLQEAGFQKTVVSGKVQAQDEFVQRLEKDLIFNLAIAIVLVMTALALIFRTERGVWIPLLTLLITTVWNLGLYGLMRKELDVLMVIIPPILLIVAMSDVIHLCNKFNELKGQGSTTTEALKVSLKEVGLATFFTSLTTAIGFLSLVVLPVAPIRDFGIYTAAGILLAYVVAFSLIPCLLLITGKAVNAPLQAANVWNRHLPVLFIKVMRNRRLVIMTGTVLGLLSLIGLALLRENTSILIGIEKDDPLAAPVVQFDSLYNGYKPFEMTMELKEGAELFDRSVLQALDSTERYLEKVYGVSHIQSPLLLVKSLNQAVKGGFSGGFNIPDEKNIGRIKRLFFSSKLKEARAPFQSEDGVTWRLYGRSRDLGSAAYEEKHKALADWLEAQNFGVKFRLTGTAYLIDKTNSWHVRTILSGLGIAIGVIALVIMLLTRSLRLTLISLIPNALPLVMIGAFMGLLEVDLNLSTAIIFSVAFGIAVDDSIHFMSRYVLEKRKNRQTLYALKRAFLSTGKSIILTTVVLFAGFAIFLQSGFSATYYIGFFVCTTLVLAVLADMILLPAILYRPKRA